MTAVLLVELVDAATLLLDVLLAWIVAIAFVVTVALYALILTGAWTWRAVKSSRATVSRLQPAPHASRDSGAHVRPVHTRPAPRWARDDKDTAA